MNSLSVWAWMFLFGHLIYATGFMFLILGVVTGKNLLAWAHERTPIADLVRWKDKPVALSIVQARLVGLAHFSAGYILTCCFLNCVHFCKVWIKRKKLITQF
jgi:photosystem I P700 chlorophyll a apoprotein A2